MRLSVQFRSSYRGELLYDVNAPRIGRVAIVKERADNLIVRLTEHGEESGIREPQVRADFAAYRAHQRTEFLEWCEIRGLNPAT
jgi:hypothetical protein